MRRSIKKHPTVSGHSYNGQKKRKMYKSLKKSVLREYRIKSNDALKKIDLENDIVITPKFYRNWAYRGYSPLHSSSIFDSEGRLTQNDKDFNYNKYLRK